jgi:serine/threonine protein kinase
MPLPATTDEFFDLVQKSAVVEDRRLGAYLEKLRAQRSWPGDPRQAAALLVRDGVLTNFQAEQILQGKWKRFTIGKYKVLERLGQGGMGSVYLCEHKLMRRRVAVKVLPTAKADDPSSLERFYREARAVAALDHPNIVRAYDIDQDEKLHFLVMEHVDGTSLQEIIKKNGPMDVLRACHYIRQAALGLQHAHDAAGLVHRDIKPGNILVDRNGIVKVLDMGLARFFYDEEDILTKKYDENVLGTADYLAPEQATDSHAVDIRADIYSLGATFYYCLTGRTPFQEGTVAQKLIWHQTRLPKPIRSFRPEVPEGVVAVIDKAMSKDVAARYQSPKEMAEALEEWTRTPIPPPPENEMPKLSLAAMGGTSDNGPPVSRPSPASPSPSPRKSWQVPPQTPEVQSKQSTAPKPPSPPPREPRALSAPTAVAPTRPAVAPQAKPQPGNNGLFRQVTTAVAATPDTTPVPPKERPKSSEIQAVAPSAVRPRPAPGVLDALSKRPWFVLVVVALAVLTFLAVGGGLAVVSFVSSKPTTPADTHNGGRPPRVYKRTNANGEPVDFKDFVAKAVAGDRLVLQDDVDAGAVQIDGVKHLTIEAEPGKNVTWRYPSGAPDGGILLIVNSAEGLTLKGITLDGGGRARTLVNLCGKSPGLALKNLQLKNYRAYGVHVTNCQGSVEKNVELSALDITTDRNQIGLYFDILDSLKSEVAANSHFRIRACKFTGTGTACKVAPGAQAQFMDVQPDLKAAFNK